MSEYAKKQLSCMMLETLRGVKPWSSSSPAPLSY